MNTTTRRDFLKQAGAFGACVCTMGAMSMLNSCAAAKTIATTETDNSASFGIKSFGDQNFVVIQTKKFDKPIFVGKQADGSYVALQMLCTHKGCTLRGGSDKLTCPCHGSEFTTTGTVIKGPATKPLQSFRVTADLQSVIVHFD
jgi:cytochrome b6-f complex iron-sulfur subunit